LVWATNFGQKGRGIVRLAAVDLTRLVAPPVEQQPVAQSSGNSSEVSERPQPELSIVTEKVQSDVIDAAAMTAESEKAKAAPVPDQIEATKDGKAKVEAVPAPFEGKSAVSDVNSGWDTVRYGVIGLLVVVMTAFTAVIYIRGHKASTSQVQAWVPRTSLIAAPAQPVIVQALSPEAALAKIEEIRRSLLELAASPSLVPSPTPEEAISSTVPAERRRKVVERA
jgi:hypothetical protein